MRVNWKREAIADLKLLENWLLTIPDAKSATQKDRFMILAVFHTAQNR